VKAPDGAPLPKGSWFHCHTTAAKPKKFDRTERALNQPQSLQARVAVLADDQMIMHGNFQGVAHRDDLTGELDVVGRRLRIAGWMIVDKNIPCLPESSSNVQSLADNLSNSIRCVSISAEAVHLHPSQMRVSLRVWRQDTRTHGSLRYPHSQRQAL
jgi:hypothetical protein